MFATFMSASCAVMSWGNSAIAADRIASRVCAGVEASDIALSAA